MLLAGKKTCSHATMETIGDDVTRIALEKDGNPSKFVDIQYANYLHFP